MTQRKAQQGCARRLVACAIAAAVPAGALAQPSDSSPAPANGDREEVVVLGELTSFGATKSNAPIVETARSIVVETRDQFVDKGALNLSQTATYLAGVAAETYGFSTRGDWIHSRGFELPRYRDSIQELFGSYNSTRADIYTIEQVEVLKGPASVLYGEGSPGGIINYVSKTPREGLENELVAEIGNHDRVELAADVNGGFEASDGRIGYRLVGLYRDAETQVEHVDDDTALFMPSITFQPNSDTRFTAVALYQDTASDTGAQFIPVEGTLVPLDSDGATYIDPDVYAGEPEFNRYDTQSSQVTLLASHELSDSLSLEATALWRDGEADYHQAWPAFLGAGASRYLNDIVGTQVTTPTTVPRTFYQADNTFEQSAVDVRLRKRVTGDDVTHDLLMGIQYQDVETDSNSASFYGGGALSDDYAYVLDLVDPEYGDVPPPSVFDGLYSDNPPQRVNDLGVYLSDQISLGSWRFTAGLRYDGVDDDDGTTVQSDDAVSTSVGALYRFDNGLSPYASYAESFETVVGTTTSGERLEPEEARQYEAGFKYEPGGFPGLFTLSAFDIEISNLPNPNSLPGDAAQQQGVSHIDGVELDARAYLGPFYVQGALAVLDAEDPNGYPRAGEPESLASIWTTWRPDGRLAGFKAGAGLRYVGESVAENATVRYVTPSYTLGDLMLGYEFDNGLDFAVNVRNVADRKYLTSCLVRGDCFPGLRRSIVGRLTKSF